jgi:hypothetical protein
MFGVKRDVYNITTYYNSYCSQFQEEIPQQQQQLPLSIQIAHLSCSFNNNKES